MNIEELERIKGTYREIRDLEEQLERFKESQTVADTVKDYRNGYGKNVVIRGIPRYGQQKVGEMRAELLVKIAKLNKITNSRPAILDMYSQNSIHTRFYVTSAH
ncbi:hypothetical protein FACS189490_13370 [Clostridia bacterium]|nr:hypothetical protein FACS189490_13370 [Clostridia bacterium]